MSPNATPWWREPTRAQWMSFAGAWFGWVLDAFDFTIFLLVIPEMERELGAGHVAASGSLALTLLARLVGGWIAGMAADRWGRKTPLLVSIVWFALCDGAIAFAPSFEAVLVLRTLFGLGMGAEWTAGTTLAMENWPARSRGIASGLLQGSWALGYMAAGVAAAFVVPRWGFRALFLVAAAPALSVVVLRAGVPESEEWQRARAERGAPAQRSASPRERLPVRQLAWASVTMAAGLGGYYALTGLYPTLLKTELGLREGAVGALVVLFNVGMMIGAVATGALASRRGAAVAIAVPALASVVVLPLYVGFWPSLLGLGAFLTGLLGAGFSGVVPLFLTESFAARHRARCVGIAYHVGAAGASVVPMTTAALSETLGVPLGPCIAWVTASMMLAVAVLVLLSPARSTPASATPALGA